MNDALTISGLTKNYKDFKLNGISFSVPCGSIVGLIGENGAGKSTTIYSILGIVVKDAGTVTILGKEEQKIDNAVRNQIGVVFDGGSFPDTLTAKKLNNIFKSVYTEWDENQFFSLLTKLSLPADKKIKEFSKGMKMKLEFAAALSHDPKLIILDEATSGLDPVFRDEILDILREYTEDEEHTILISSHITSDLDKISDYIAFLHEGRLLFVKTYDEIQENYGVLNCGQRIFDALDREDIEAYRKEAYGYRVLVKNKQEIRKVFSDLEIEAATIEDVMLYCVKGEKVA